MYKVPHNTNKGSFPAWISYVFNGLLFSVIYYLKAESIIPYPSTIIIIIVYFITIIISDTLSKFDNKWNYGWIFIQSIIICISLVFIMSQDHINLLAFSVAIIPVFLMPYIFSMKKRLRSSK